MSLQDFDKEVNKVVAKGKLSAAAVQSVVDHAMANITSDANLLSTLFRAHKKATSPNKLTSLYLVDAVAREAKTRARKSLKEEKDKGKGKETDSPRAPIPAPETGSTTPTDEPPPLPLPSGSSETTPAKASLQQQQPGSAAFMSFLAKVEGVLSKFVLDCWENGPKEHREKVRKVLDIWTKAGTFNPTVLARISNKLLASSSVVEETAAAIPDPTQAKDASPAPPIPISGKYFQFDLFRPRFFARIGEIGILEILEG
ncbi:hypothetical protein T439DRAFT_328049 [Meredithblackwellia eburnea MCA 4105]